MQEVEDDLDQLMKRFRVCTRELFNNYFYANHQEWNSYTMDLDRRFCRIQEVMFEQMVIDPAELTKVPYGKEHSQVRVVPNSRESIPAMINREVKSGYWDFPEKTLPSEAELHFISFFDWADLEIRENRYVRVLIAKNPAHPETEGKHALIEAAEVVFRKVSE